MFDNSEYAHIMGKEYKEYTPLMKACCLGKLKVVKAVLEVDIFWKVKDVIDNILENHCGLRWVLNFIWISLIGCLIYLTSANSV